MIVHTALTASFDVTRDVLLAEASPQLRLLRSGDLPTIERLLYTEEGPTLKTLVLLRRLDGIDKYIATDQLTNNRCMIGWCYHLQYGHYLYHAPHWLHADLLLREGLL